MERETKEITTPIENHKVVIYTYLTGREKRELTNIFLSSAKFSLENNQGLKADNFDATVANKAKDKAINLLVLSVDDNKENILDKLLDMRSEDYDFVSQEIDKLTNPTSKKK